MSKPRFLDKTKNRALVLGLPTLILLFCIIFIFIEHRFCKIIMYSDKAFYGCMVSTIILIISMCLTLRNDHLSFLDKINDK